MGLILALTARARSFRIAGAVARLDRHHLSRAAYVWAFSMATILVGAVGEVEGFSQPIWIAVVATGSAGPLVARRRWVQEVSSSSVDRAASPAPVSTSWEIAFVGAALGAFAVYAATLAHGWGHLVHRLIAGVGAGLGYALGLTVATPRYTVRRRQS